MTQGTPPDWAAIRHRYETSQDPVTEICAAAGISARDFDNRRRREKWRRANPRPFPPPRRPKGAKPSSRAEAANPTAAPDTVTASDTSPAAPSGARPHNPRRQLLERLVGAIDMKLEQLERRMSKDLAENDVTPATDHERETRAIGALIDNLEKITEMETGVASSSRSRGTTQPATDLADEAERCRRELAERLSRLVEAAGRSA